MGKALTIAALALPPLLAAETAFGQAAVQSTKDVYRSAYFLGRGDTGIATADDEDAIFYNPAGIAQGKGIYKKTVLISPQLEVSQSTRDLAREVGAQQADAVDTVQKHIGKPNHIGASNFTGLILRRAALGAIVTSNVDLLAYKDPKAGGLEAVHASADSTAGATFTLADGFFGDKLLLGLTAKYLERGRGDISVNAAEAETVKDKLSDQSNFLAKGQGGGADVGLMYHPGGSLNPAFGLTVDDAGDTHITPDDKTELDLDLKQTVNFGVSIEPGTSFSKLKLLADYHDALSATTTNPRKKIHLGGELSVLDMIGITGGINQGYPTAGLYADLYFARLDMVMYTEEMSDRVGTRPDTRYVFRLHVGF